MGRVRPRGRSAVVAVGLLAVLAGCGEEKKASFTQVGSTIGTTASGQPEGGRMTGKAASPARLPADPLPALPAVNEPTAGRAKLDDAGPPPGFSGGGLPPPPPAKPAAPSPARAGGRSVPAPSTAPGGPGGRPGMGAPPGIGMGGSPDVAPDDLAKVEAAKQLKEAEAKLADEKKSSRYITPPAGYDALRQEQYRHYVDNAFKPVAQEPLSTFSADVNTAGYSNVRRYLTQGQLPPADAVRAAELLNFFNYKYPEPPSGEPVAFALAAMPCPWQPAHQLVRIGLKARQIDPAHAPPRNLVFLIDTSGSMQQPTRLPLVQRSLGLLIDQLTEKDTVTVVTYAGSAGVKLPPTNGGQKARIRSVVDGLHAGGSTNGAGGIQVAYEQARANYIEGGCNRVVLCTDGDFNVGVTAEGDLVRTIEKQREGNVFLTVLGYGMGNLKDATLEILARHGNGHYAYIDTEAEARKVFVEQGGALTAVAKDVKLQVEFNPAKVGAYRLIGYENRKLETQDFKDDTKDAGDLGSGHTVTALYELIPAAADTLTDPLKYQHAASATPAARSGEWLTAKMRYKHPESAKSLEVQAVLSADAAKRPADGDFRFAAAVAEFSLLLRDGKDKASASFDRVLEAAGASVGADPHGHRAEFVRLVQAAKRLAGPEREAATR